MVLAIKGALGCIKVFLTASAIGIYGEGGENTFTEKSKIGENFLAKLCHDWEQESKN